MATKVTAKGATVAEEKKKLLQQYRDDDGHFSLVRLVTPLLSSGYS